MLARELEFRYHRKCIYSKTLHGILDVKAYFVAKCTELSFGVHR